MSLGRIPKRSKATKSTSEEGGVEMADLREREQSSMLAALFSPINGASVYNMRVEGDKARLARDLWVGNFEASMAGLREANKEFVEVLRAQISNSSKQTERSLLADERHIDGILLDACRAQNQFRVPLVAAATSLLGEVNKTAREVHDASALYHMGTTMSEKWTEDFCVLAMTVRPPPAYVILAGVVVCCFDNLSMQIDYKSYASQGEVGRRLDMTNWFSCPLPRSLAPTLDATAIRRSACLDRASHPPNPSACSQAVEQLSLSLSLSLPLTFDYAAMTHCCHLARAALRVLLTSSSLTSSSLTCTHPPTHPPTQVLLTFAH
jgi:hypothetical protein